MENYEGCIDAAWLLDSLLKVLPIVLKSVMRHRHQHKQAKFLGRLFADLHLLRERNEALPLKAVMELKLMCTVIATRHNALPACAKGIAVDKAPHQYFGSRHEDNRRACCRWSYKQ
jgi:hypothetical protein